MTDYFKALLAQYLSEANAYAAKFGLDPQTANTDGHWDAFRHAYASAAMTQDYGRPAELLEAHGQMEQCCWSTHCSGSL